MQCLTPYLEPGNKVQNVRFTVLTVVIQALPYYMMSQPRTQYYSQFRLHQKPTELWHEQTDVT
jgi:hypothetical protein